MLKRIQIANMGPFESFDSGDLPAVVLIDGDNGVGKTGLQDCIKWVGESGHDPDILHGAAQSGEVVIITDDGTQLRVRTTRDDTTRYWKPKNGRRWIKGREEIDKIYRALAYSPLDFLKLKEDKQAEEFAKLSQDQADPGEIAKAIEGAETEAEAAKIVPGMSGLDRLNALIASINESRTRLNVGADRQEKHAAELERTLPPPAPEGQDWDAAAERLQGEKEALERLQNQTISEIAAELQGAKATANSTATDEKADWDRRIDLAIRRLEAVRKVKHHEADNRKDAAIETARAEANRKADDIQSANAPKLEQLTTDLATARERARAQQEAGGTRKAIAAARAGASNDRARRTVLTAAVERLERLKIKLAAQVMEKTGARLEGGRIVREQDGGLTPLKRWNTADQWTFCLRFGMMLGGGFVCVDGINVFTDANQKALFETAHRYADERGVQFIFTKVRPEGGEMRITSPRERVSRE